jgi:thiol-disulfide isomerase/thioredoxin
MSELITTFVRSTISQIARQKLNRNLCDMATKVNFASLIAAFALVITGCTKNQTPDVPTATDSEATSTDVVETKAPTLVVGSVAPEIDIEHWISDNKGAFPKVTKFESGKVYVIEFWATWCGPCVASMPHLAELQGKYALDGMQLISISDESLDTVNEFLKTSLPAAIDDTMTYGELTSAYCLTTDPDKSVYKSYMEAADKHSIPTAFIVGRSGLIEWIGHPMEMEPTLTAVLSNTFDRNAAKIQYETETYMNEITAKVSTFIESEDFAGAKALLDQAKNEKQWSIGIMPRLTMLYHQVAAEEAFRIVRSGKVDEGMKLFDELRDKMPEEMKAAADFEVLDELLTQQSFDKAAVVIERITQVPNLPLQISVPLTQQVFGVLVNALDKPEQTKTLLAAGTKLSELTVQQAPNQPIILDTYAHYLYLSGKLQEAIEVTNKALEADDGTMRASLQQFLKEVQTELDSK